MKTVISKAYMTLIQVEEKYISTTMDFEKSYAVKWYAIIMSLKFIEIGRPCGVVFSGITKKEGIKDKEHEGHV